MRKLALSLVLLAAACDPAGADVIDGNVALTDDWSGDRFVELVNVAPATVTLPPDPRVGCTLIYAVLGPGAVTFGGGGKQIKPTGSDPAPTLEWGPQTTKTGRITFDGVHWVHLGGLH